jgi:hypothetical protein
MRKGRRPPQTALKGVSPPSRGRMKGPTEDRIRHAVAPWPSGRPSRARDERAGAGYGSPHGAKIEACWRRARSLAPESGFMTLGVRFGGWPSRPTPTWGFSSCPSGRAIHAQEPSAFR